MIGETVEQFMNFLMLCQNVNIYYHNFFIQTKVHVTHILNHLYV